MAFPDDETTDSEARADEVQDQEPKGSEAAAAAEVQDKDAADSEARAAAAQEKGTGGEDAAGDEAKAEQAARDREDNLRKINADLQAARREADEAKSRLAEIDERQATAQARQDAADDAYVDELYNTPEVQLEDGAWVSGREASAIFRRQLDAERNARTRAADQRGTLSKAAKDALFKETIDELYPDMTGAELAKIEADLRVRLAADPAWTTRDAMGRPVFTHARMLAEVAAVRGNSVQAKDAEIAALKEELAAKELELTGKRAEDAGGPPGRTNGAASGGALTPEIYREKLQRGEEVDPAEVDAMTAKYR